MNRRSFLAATSTMLVAHSPILFATEDSFDSALSATKEPQKTRLSHSTSTIDPGLSRRQWKTIVAVQNHLFPVETNNGKRISPGAKDVNSQAYLYAVLSDPHRDNADRLLVKDGLIELQDICWKKHQQLFIDLSQQQREASLRTFENTPNGTPWIMTVLGYVFEALLVDPVYGGNPDGIGWKWLEHQAGLPRPTMETRYFLL